MTPRLILASASPRRKDLLTTIGIPIFKILPSHIEESRNDDEELIAYCSRLAIEKSQALDISEGVILAADTIVTQDTSLFEKPVDDHDAVRILSQLSGKWHTVITSWALYQPQTKLLKHGYTASDVLFRPLTSQEILSYVHTKEGRDKAGAYGIQGLGAALISSIKGSYSNIVGLPLESILPELASLGITPVEPS